MHSAAGTWPSAPWNRSPWTCSSCTCQATPSPSSPSWWSAWWPGDPYRRWCPCQPVSIHPSGLFFSPGTKSFYSPVCFCTFLWPSLQAVRELQSAVAAGPGLPDREPSGGGAGHLQVSVNGAPSNTLIWLVGIHRTASGNVVNTRPSQQHIVCLVDSLDFIAINKDPFSRFLQGESSCHDAFQKSGDFVFIVLL